MGLRRAGFAGYLVCFTSAVTASTARRRSAAPLAKQRGEAAIGTGGSARCRQPAAASRESLTRSCASSMRMMHAASSADKPASSRSRLSSAHTVKRMRSELRRRSIVGARDSEVDRPMLTLPRQLSSLATKEVRSGKPISAHTPAAEAIIRDMALTSSSFDSAGRERSRSLSLTTGLRKLMSTVGAGGCDEPGGGVAYSRAILRSSVDFAQPEGPRSRVGLNSGVSGCWRTGRRGSAGAGCTLEDSNQLRSRRFMRHLVKGMKS